MLAHRSQVVMHSLWLILEWHVRHVFHSRHYAFSIRYERGEQRVEVVVCRAGDGDQFEGLK